MIVCTLDANNSLSRKLTMDLYAVIQQILEINGYQTVPVGEVMSH